MQKEVFDKGSYEVRSRGWKHLSILRVTRQEDKREIREYGIKLWKLIVLFEVPEIFADALEKQLAEDDSKEELEKDPEKKKE